MKTIKILVTGGDGQLGSELRHLQKEFPFDFIFTDYHNLDITDEEAVSDFFNENRLDYVINGAAYTAVDKAEIEPEKAYQINETGAKNIANACFLNKVKMFHISTDYVFSGNVAKLLNESQSTDPLSVYGNSKLAGEKKVEESGADYFIFRTAWLYSSFGNNFVKTMNRLGREKEELSVVGDQIGTPTWARDLAFAILKGIEDLESGDISPESGIYHYSNEGVASWYDFAFEIMETAGLNCKVFPIHTSDYPTPAQRPAFSILDKTHFKNSFQQEIQHWKKALQGCLSEGWKNN